MDTPLGIIQSFLYVLGLIWWIFLPIILLAALRNIWLVYVQDRSIKEIRWSLFEIKVPKDVLKTPKAMEQIFSAMYASYSHGIDFLMKYIDGFVDDWYSFEVVGHSQGINFYIFAPSVRKPVIESAVYSEYPNAEITEANDYTELLPGVLPNKDYNLWGADLKLNRESFYPIRTYPYFEEAQEEKRLDPIGALAEVMSGLKENEWLWWQVIVCPTSNDVGIRNDWKEQGEEMIAKLSGQQKKSAPKGVGSTIAEWFQNLILAPIEHPVWPDAEKKAEGPSFKFLNPAESEMAKAIDNKISKLGFDTVIRFVYIAPAHSFSSAVATAVMGTIRRFNTQNLNSFGPGAEKTLVTGWKPKFIPFYYKFKLFSQRKKIFSNYKLRKLRSKMVGKFRMSSTKITTMNTEELASIYHFPTMMVGAPKLGRIESKKGGPPSGLPVE